jgi:hypothetical protein
LRRELDRWCACKRFVYQFSLLAKPQPRPKKRAGGQGSFGVQKSGLWRPSKHKPGLAAVKHAQQLAERTAHTEQQGRAFAALAHVLAHAGDGGGWPEGMRLELQACKTPADKNAWAQKWGSVLNGQAERDRRGRPERPAANYTGGEIGPKAG